MDNLQRGVVRERDDKPGRRLPQRWVTILSVSGVAGFAGFQVAGPVGGITAACTMAVALHKLVA
jgi:hypothetical protein